MREEMEKTEYEKNAASRLFEALSGVDGAYLEACEADAGVLAQDRKKEDGGAGRRLAARQRSLFVRKYGLVAAAALCVALFGVSYFGQQTNKTGTEEANMPMDEIGHAANAKEIAWDAEMAGGAVDISEETAKEESYVARSEAALDEKMEKDAEKTEPDKEEYQKEEIKDLKDGSETEKMTVDEGVQGDPMSGITLVEARRIAVAGAYLPMTFPADGHLESVRGTDTAGSESAYLTWVYGNGRDSFFWSVQNLGQDVSESVKEAIVDVDVLESYDVRMYEIPYADSVPEQYRVTVMDPVFRIEDFSKECIEARIVPHTGDSGDTDTPRGNFCVLYRTAEGDHVLVRFSGNGNAEELWQMFVYTEIWK